MDYQLFLVWLRDERHMAARSARDVVSRLKRVVNILQENEIDGQSIYKLEEISIFSECSIYIKSQLRRSIKLYLEFTNSKVS